MAFLAKKHLHVEDKQRLSSSGGGGSLSTSGGGDRISGLEMGVGLFAADPAALAEEELLLEQRAELDRENLHRSSGGMEDDGGLMVKSMGGALGGYGSGGVDNFLGVAEEVYCICRGPDIPGVFMLQCEQCDEWFHGPCIGLEQHKMADLIDEFVCMTCNPIAHEQLIQQVLAEWEQQQAVERAQAAARSRHGDVAPATAAPAAKSSATPSLPSSSLSDSSDAIKKPSSRKTAKSSSSAKRARDKVNTPASSTPSTEVEGAPARKKARTKSSTPAVSRVGELCVRIGCDRAIPTRRKGKYCSDVCALTVARSRLCHKRVYTAAEAEHDLAIDLARQESERRTKLWRDVLILAREMTNTKNSAAELSDEPATMLPAERELLGAASRNLMKLPELDVIIHSSVEVAGPGDDLSSSERSDRLKMIQLYRSLHSHKDRIALVHQRQAVLQRVFDALPRIICEELEEDNSSKEVKADMTLECVICRRRQPALQLQRHMVDCYRKHSLGASAAKSDTHANLQVCGCPLLGLEELPRAVDSGKDDAEILSPFVCRMRRADCLQHVRWEDTRMAYHSRELKDVLDHELKLKNALDVVHARILARAVQSRKSDQPSNGVDFDVDVIG